MSWMGESFSTNSKTWDCLSWRFIKLSYFRYFQIWAWSRSSLVNVLILVSVRIIIDHCWRWIFLRKDSTVHLTSVWACIIFHYFFALADRLLVDHSTFSLIHWSKCFTSETRSWFIIVQGMYSFYIVRARSYINNRLLFTNFLLFGLRPAWNSFRPGFLRDNIMPRSNFILFLTFINLNWRLVELKFVI